MRTEEFEHRLLSRPVDVYWAGWRSDTLTLQQHGWSIAADQDIARMTMQIALRHEQGRMMGVSAGIDWRYYEDHYRTFEPGRQPPLNIAHLSSRYEIVTHDMRTQWDAFKPIDAVPQMVTGQRRSLDDLIHFAPALTRTKEIIIPEQSVPELMERILKLQEPDRIERLRQSVRNAEGYTVDGIPRQKFHAQILSIA